MRYSGKIKNLNHIVVSDPSYDEDVTCRYERDSLKGKNWLVDIDVYPYKEPVTDEIDIKGTEFYILLHKDRYCELKEEGTIRHLKGIKVSSIDIGMDTACVALGVNEKADEIITERQEWQPECSLRTLTDGIFGDVREGKLGNEVMFICISGYLDEDTGYCIEDIIDYLEFQLNIVDLVKDKDRELINQQEKILTEMTNIELKFKEITKDDSNLIKFFKGDKRFYNISYAGAYLAGMELRNDQRIAGNLEGELEKSPYTQEQELLIDEYSKLMFKYQEKEHEIENDNDMEM